jgi:hypothetical protein
VFALLLGGILELSFILGQELVVQRAGLVIVDEEDLVAHRQLVPGVEDPSVAVIRRDLAYI